MFSTFFVTADPTEIIQFEPILIFVDILAPIPKRAVNCEKTLINSNLSEESFEKAKKNLEKDFKPINDMRATKDYRMEVAKNLLMKCFIEIKKNKLIRLN